MWNVCQKLCACRWEEQAWMLNFLTTTADFKESMGFLMKNRPRKRIYSFELMQVLHQKYIKYYLDMQDFIFCLTCMKPIENVFVQDKTNWSNLLTQWHTGCCMQLKYDFSMQPLWSTSWISIFKGIIWVCVLVCHLWLNISPTECLKWHMFKIRFGRAICLEIILVKYWFTALLWAGLLSKLEKPVVERSLSFNDN